MLPRISTTMGPTIMNDGAISLKTPNSFRGVPLRPRLSQVLHLLSLFVALPLSLESDAFDDDLEASARAKKSIFRRVAFPS